MQAGKLSARKYPTATYNGNVDRSNISPWRFPILVSCVLWKNPAGLFIDSSLHDVAHAMPEDWHYVEVRHEGFKCRVRFCSNWSQRVSIHVRSQNTTTARLINPVVHAYAKLFSNESSVLFVLFRGYGLRNRFIDPLSAYRCSMWRIG